MKIALAIVLLASLAAVGCQAESPRQLQIGETIYDFPRELSRVVRPGEGRPYASYREADWSFVLTYDARHQDLVDQSGRQNVRALTGISAAPEDIQWHDTGAGKVACNKRTKSTRLRFQCGTSFILNGARWQLTFDPDKLDQVGPLRQAAIARLISFAKRPLNR